MPNAQRQSTREGLSHEEFMRYSRHLLLPEVALTGQKRLKKASVLVIGTGGLGSPAAMYLAAAGVGHIGLVDYDVVEVSNLQRQVIHGTNSLGMRKVRSAQARLQDINPTIQVDAYDQPFTSANAMDIAKPYEVVIDCSDNFPTRYLSNDVCVLQGKPNVYGSIFRFEGQASVFWAESGPCYRCIFPEPPPPGTVPSCGESGVLGLLPGIIGTIQATEAIKLLLTLGETLQGKLLLYDALAMRFESLQLKKNPKCKACSTDPEITSLIDYEAFCGVPSHDRGERLLPETYEMDPTALANRISRNPNLQLIDVREPHEAQISSIAEADLIPLGELAARVDELDRDQETVLLCRTGTRSARALQLLAGAGFEKLHHLKGGINAWAEVVDPSLPRY